MQEARKLGNFIENLAAEKKISVSSLSQQIGCSDLQLERLFKGLAIASFAQISKLAASLGVSVSALLSGDTEKYNHTVVHCMNDFQDVEKREMILDLIDDYVDVVDAISMAKN